MARARAEKRFRYFLPGRDALYLRADLDGFLFDNRVDPDVESN
jgi:hypothetical protein